MDLHVVELRSTNRKTQGEVPRELDSFRKDGVYDVAEGKITYARPWVEDSEFLDDPVETLGLMCGRIADAVAAGFAAGEHVVVAGGNCGALPGVIGGLQQAKGSTARIGLVWFDAHGDFNTPKTTLSGMLGGMPVAVVAGLCYPDWRIGAHQEVALPTDRIVMVDVRNLDPAEEQLVKATAVDVVPVSGPKLAEAVKQLADKTDLIYLHIDLDILDESLTPSHGTKEPNGPDMATTVAAVQTVLDTGKVEAVGLVSVYPVGEGGDTSLASGTELLREMIRRWAATKNAAVAAD
jgi:arginase